MRKKRTDDGIKAYQRTDTEWRSKPYSDWHRTLDRWVLMSDVDSVEWRYRDGELVAVGVMEVTRVDAGTPVTQGYLDAIIRRIDGRDAFQAEAVRTVADALDTNAYVVLFREDCTEFWLYNLTLGGGWLHLDEDGMRRFLRGL